ncbi:MAG: sulfatase [Planctomycetota bacterium]
MLLIISLAWLTSCDQAVPAPPLAAGPGAPALILMIVIDTLRHDHVGGELTPVLNALARRSLVFANARTTSSWTGSSVASMFTSRFPTEVGVLARDDVLGPTAVTLAEALRAGGNYECAGITTNTNAGDKLGIAQGFDSFIMPDVSTAKSYPDDHLMFPARSVTEAAVSFLRDRSTRPHQRPCFLFLHYIDPHAPYLPHPGILPTREPDGRFDGSRRQLDVVDAMSVEDLTAADRARIKYLYAADVKYCDDWIGGVLREVAAQGLASSTMVIVTADHGEGLWNHGIRNHGRDLYEEMLHVPLIVHYPGMRESDSRTIATPVSLLDLAPTILAACHIPQPQEFHGQDLEPLARGKRRDQELDDIYSEMAFDRVNLECLRRGRFKLIRDRDRSEADPTSYQLFDLAEDPGEQHNLIGARPDVEADLQRALKRCATVIARGARPRVKLALDDLPPFDLDILRSLGYVGSQEYETTIARRQAGSKPQ